MNTVEKKNIAKPLMVAGGFLAGLVVISTAVRVITNAGQSTKVSETEIEIISPASPAPTPMIGQSQDNMVIEDSMTRLTLSGDYLKQMADNSFKELINARAKRWLIFASTEAPKTKQTEGEYLTQKILSFSDRIATTTNNGAMEPTPEKMDQFISDSMELLAINEALTTTPQGGANMRVNTSGLIAAANDVYIKAVSLNNVQRFGSEKVLSNPIQNRTEPSPAPEMISPKTDEEVTTNE